MDTLHRILELQKEKNVKQKEICKACGISESSFDAWRKGTTESYKKYLPQIAEALGVSVSYLIDGEMSPAEEFYTKYKNAEPHVQQAINELLKIEKK